MLTGFTERPVGRLRPPAHAVDGLAGNRIDAGADDGKSLPPVKPNRAGIVGVDVEIEAPWRNALGRVDQCRADAGSPRSGRDHQLVEIIFAIDRHKSEQCAGVFGDDDRRLRG